MIFLILLVINWACLIAGIISKSRTELLWANFALVGILFLTKESR